MKDRGTPGHTVMVPFAGLTLDVSVAATSVDVSTWGELEYTNTHF